MSITTTIDHAHGMIIATSGPMVTDHDWLWLQAALRSLVDSGLAFDQLVDLRPVKDCRLSPNVIHLSSKRPALAPGSRQALVAGDNLAYGMCRMYEILSASRSLKIEVFRGIGAARAWLGLASGPQPEVAPNKVAAHTGVVTIRS
ncbi:MAG: hypothetical protein QNJ04_11600 [Desulfobacterales bacterium]|nr:hypothetical protein [Desulfobacterales bacterium]